MPRRSRQGRDPVQVYLDEPDRNVLEQLAERSGLARAELLRLGLRRLAVEMLRHHGPGSGIAALKGSLDAAPEAPPDPGSHGPRDREPGR